MQIPQRTTGFGALVFNSHDFLASERQEKTLSVVFWRAYGMAL